MAINLEDYRKAKAPHSPTPAADYGDEVMYVNWNPTVAISATLGHQDAHGLSPTLPEDSDSVDVDAFLDRIYTFASQV